MARGDFYDEDGTTDRQDCPRCEHSFLADHGERLHCGKCSYTEWK